MALPTRTDFWGVELSAKKKEAIWDADEPQEGDAPMDEPDIVHTLHLQRVVLGVSAKDETHLLTISAEDSAGEEITHPLCWLGKKSISECQQSMHMALPPPVTLKLVQGSGPVHVYGMWEQQFDEDFGDSDEDMGIDEDVDSKPVAKTIETKQIKRPASSPPPKPSKMAKKDDRSKVPKDIIVQKKAAVTTAVDSDEEDDEDDKVESGDDEEDSDDDMNFEGESDEEEGEEESEDEAPPPPKKKPQQAKAATPKQKGAMATPKSIGDKAKKPGKGTPSVPRSLDEMKAKLAKSPNVPKKREKFNNYLHNNFKVTDAEMKNKLWDFVKATKH